MNDCKTFCCAAQKSCPVDREKQSPSTPWLGIYNNEHLQAAEVFIPKGQGIPTQGYPEGWNIPANHGYALACSEGGGAFLFGKPETEPACIYALPCYRWGGLLHD